MRTAGNSAAADMRKVTGEGLTQMFIVCMQDRVPRHHDKVHCRCRNRQHLVAEILPHQALDAISIHGPPQLFLGDRQPKAGSMLSIFTNSPKHGEVPVGGTDSAGKDPRELGGLQQAVLTRKGPQRSSTAAGLGWCSTGLTVARVQGDIAVSDRGGTGIDPRHPAQGARRARPFARRALITLRPERVAIRARKPWVRARFRLLG